MDDLRPELTGSISAFTGNSGVGKSTLLNLLVPELELATGETSKKLGRGRHTTRHVELYPVEGGYVADTPGFSTMDIERYARKSCRRDSGSLRRTSANANLPPARIPAKKAARY